jgi:Flp pilus assembly protein TadB
MMFAPDYVALLWTDPAGRRIAILAGCWLIIGIAVLQRMARVEI